MGQLSRDNELIQRQVALVREEVNKAVERRFQKLKAELMTLMDLVHLNNARIESMVEQMNGLSRMLLQLEGQL